MSCYHFGKEVKPELTAYKLEGQKIRELMNDKQSSSFENFVKACKLRFTVNSVLHHEVGIMQDEKNKDIKGSKVDTEYEEAPDDLLFTLMKRWRKSSVYSDQPTFSHIENVFSPSSPIFIQPENLNVDESVEGLERCTEAAPVANEYQSLALSNMGTTDISHLHTLSVNRPTEMKNLILKMFSELDEVQIRDILPHVSICDDNFKSELLRDFIAMIDKVEKGDIFVLETLVNNQTSDETFQKLVQLLYNVCDDFSKDKAFGKLLLHIIEVLGQNVTPLEQLLRHIIAGHQSIWKIKIVKVFSQSYEDSMVLSQSLH